MSGNFVGKETYTVSIAQTLQDICGQTLKDPVITELEFEHAFSSYFSCPRVYMVLENYLEKIIPLQMVNVSSFECKSGIPMTKQQYRQNMPNGLQKNITMFHRSMAQELFSQKMEQYLKLIQLYENLCRQFHYG